MEQSRSWEANRFSDSQEIPAFYGTRRFITAVTSACHMSLSSASSIQSMPPLPEDPSYTSPPLFRILCQMHPVHALPFRFFVSRITIILPSTPTSSTHSVLPVSQPNAPCILLSLIGATSPTHLTIEDFFTLVTSGNTNHEAPHYAVFSGLMLLSPTWAHMFSSAPCSRTLSPPFFRQLRHKNSQSITTMFVSIYYI